MSVPEIWGLIPVKDFHSAKQRMSPVLAPEERAVLARTMLLDVLAAFAASDIERIAVVTGDSAVVEVARKAGALVIAEAHEGGLDGAVATGVAALSSRASVIVAVPSDVPMITPEVLLKAAGIASGGRQGCLAPACEEGGTNLLAFAPHLFPQPSFGPGSFERHLKAARAAAVEVVTLSGENVGLDLDRPGDLLRHQKIAPMNRTRSLLDELEIAKRFPLRPDHSRHIGFEEYMS